MALDESKSETHEEADGGESDSAAHRVVVFDVETDSLPSRYEKGVEAFSLVEVTVATAVCVHLTLEGSPSEAILVREDNVIEWRHREEDGMPFAEGRRPFARLLEAFDRADCIVAFNGLAFDMPALYKYYPRVDRRERFAAHLRKIFDPFARIRGWMDGWPNLDGLLAANSLATKTSSGAEAIVMWEDESRHAELQAYCLQDSVALFNLVMIETGVLIEGDPPNPQQTTFKRSYTIAHPAKHSMPVDVTSVRAHLASKRWCAETSRLSEQE